MDSLASAARLAFDQEATRVVLAQSDRDAGLSGLSRFLGWTATLGLVGAALFGAPVLAAINLADTFANRFAVVVLAALTGLAMLTIFLVVGVLPQWWIANVIREAKSRQLRALIDRNPVPALDSPPDVIDEEMRSDIELFDHVWTRSNWTFRTETGIQWAIAIVSIAVTILLAAAGDQL